MISDAKPGMNGRRIGKIREIEAEFGEPFWDGLTNAKGNTKHVWRALGIRP